MVFKRKKLTHNGLNPLHCCLVEKDLVLEGKTYNAVDSWTSLFENKNKSSKTKLTFNFVWEQCNVYSSFIKMNALHAFWITILYILGKVKNPITDKHRGVAKFFIESNTIILVTRVLFIKNFATLLYLPLFYVFFSDGYR